MFRCDNIIHLEDTKDDPLKDDNILVKIYFKRMESHLQSFGIKNINIQCPFFWIIITVKNSKYYEIMKHKIEGKYLA